jgi:hypothetical protein
MTMFRWIVNDDEGRPRDGGPEVVVRVAAPQGKEPVTVGLELETDGAAAPTLTAHTRGRKDQEVTPVPVETKQGVVRYILQIDPPADPTADDEVTIDLRDPVGSDVPPCRVVLRRTRCQVSAALVGQGEGCCPLGPETEAALRWQGWKRASELVVLKRFETGRGGSAVLVVRPRLRAPEVDQATLESSGPPEVAEGALGSCWLVKSGPANKVRREWDRFNTYLADRAHPYLGHCETFLAVRPSGDGGPPATATLVSSFLGGGELIRPEPLDEVLRGPVASGRVGRLLDRVFAVLAPWSHDARVYPLARWRRVFRGNENEWLLFGKFDLARERRTKPGDNRGRAEFTAGLDWDVAFIQEKHLRDHLLGKHRDGLLYKLREIEAAYSLTHGDMNPRNVLCEGDDVWLIDFEAVGVAPTLLDFARLEANLRLWCLRLGPTEANVEDVAAAFETRLLDHFLGNTGSLGPVSELALALDADPENLMAVAQAIAQIRRLAARSCLPRYPDRRDYLAVLYLTVLSLLQYAGEVAAPPPNYRVLVGLAWVLEDTLSRIMGMRPFPRRRVALDPKSLISVNWLIPPGAPQRVAYMMDREDGHKAMPHLAATRGVIQSQVHHLDVFDHTLLVLAYVEALLDPRDGDPISGFLDPAALDRRVAASLRDQRVHLLPIPAPEADPVPPDVSDLGPLLDQVRDYLRPSLADPEARALLKWTALLHDVGKPGTRCMNTDKSPPEVQFLRHEIYGLQLLGGLLMHLFPEPERLERMKCLIKCHHLHHQLGEHYKQPRTPPSEPKARKQAADLEARFRALAKGLVTRMVPDAEMKTLGSRLDPASEDYQVDFPLLILHGYADSLACRGPDAKAPAGEVARVDLVLLAFAALYPEVAKAQDGLKKAKAKKTDLFRDVSEELRKEAGIDPEPWVPVWPNVMCQIHPWYEQESQKRRPTGAGGPTFGEVMVKAREILRTVHDRPADTNR